MLCHFLGKQQDQRLNAADNDNTQLGKVVFLIGGFGRGGCERQAFLLARELKQRRGVDVEVWALVPHEQDDEFAGEFEAAGVPIRTLDFRRPACPIWPVRTLHWTKRVWQVACAIKEAKVNILLPFTTWPNVVAGLAYRPAGVAACIWGERHCGSERIPGVERIAVRLHRQFVANSTAGVDFLATEMRVQRERIAFVPNAVEEPAGPFETDWRARLGVARDQLLAIKIANLTIRKDHATLLRAWKLVQDAWDNHSSRPVLALAGRHCDTYTDCQRIVREAGISSTVRFLGGISDVPSLVHGTDLAVFSSHSEGMPNGVLECMAAGKPVVATDLPGIRDALGARAGEVLVPPGDAEALARKMLDMLKNREKRDALGRANWLRIRGEFSIEQIAQKHLAIIKDSLEQMPRLRLRRPLGLPA